jgi:hypothetical protein
VHEGYRLRLFIGDGRSPWTFPQECCFSAGKRSSEHEVRMLQGELELFKPGKGAFYATELQDWLQARHITHLLFAGVTTEVRPEQGSRHSS